MISSTIPSTAGFDCKYGKEYFTSRPKEEVINDLLAIQTHFPVIAKGNTILHLAATITEIPDLLTELIDRKPELAEFLHTLNSSGNTPLDIQQAAHEIVTHQLPLLLEPEAKSKTKKRFALDELRAIAIKNQSKSSAMVASTLPGVNLPTEEEIATASLEIEIAQPAKKQKVLTEVDRMNLLSTLLLCTDQNNEYKANGLHMAARITNFPELMGLLLERNPEFLNHLEDCDYKGLTPFERAIEAQNEGAISALLAAMAQKSASCS